MCDHPSCIKDIKVVLISGCEQEHLEHAKLCENHALKYRTYKKLCMVCGKPAVEWLVRDETGVKPADNPLFYIGEWVAVDNRNRVLVHDPFPEKVHKALKDYKIKAYNMYRVGSEAGTRGA
jgi:hypothetical protein